MNIVSHICEQCGAQFDAVASSNRLYCSRTCYHISTRVGPNTACIRCGARFYSKPSNPGKFCSRDCKAEYGRTRPRNDPRPCVVCGTVFKPERHRGDAQYCSKSCIWKATKGPEFNAKIALDTATVRADKMRGTGEGKGYRKRGGRHEHRVVAEEKLGRALMDSEVVHHKDKNKQNNDPGNLEVMTKGEHMIEHGIGVPGVTPWWEPWKYRKPRR